MLLQVITLQRAVCRTVIVDNQKTFDNIGIALKEALQAGDENVVLRFLRGTYYYKENHISLNGVNAASTSLTINGCGVTLIPKGKNYRNGDKYQGLFDTNQSVVNISKKRDVSYWGNIFYAESRVELVDKKRKLWRIKCSHLKNATPQECCLSYVLLTSAYRANTLKVDHIEDGYLYFLSDNFSYNNTYNCYDLDFDYGYCKQYSRFKICNNGEKDVFGILPDGNVCLPVATRKAHVCEAGTFIKVKDCIFREIQIKGLEFLGASNTEKQSSLIDVTNTRICHIHLKNNSFIGMRNNVIGIFGTDNVTVEENKFRECYITAINADNACKNTRVIGNNISYCGLSMAQNTGVHLCGEDFLVAGNVINDYGYTAIRTGVHYTKKEGRPCRGVIENNEIYYTKSYLKDIDNHALMDGGAIYVATQNSGTIIRKNYIHDIDGRKYNRGIFCDDGTRYVSICENTIVRILNSYCIDLRRVSFVETYCGIANIGNVIRDNILDGGIRFEGREDVDNGCELGVNYLVPDGGSMKIDNKIDNVKKTDFFQVKKRKP